ncbi:MAG: hypothetical protein R2733_12975 [Acidimicrobiales bacterium]
MSDRNHHSRATVPLGIELDRLPDIGSGPDLVTRPGPSPLELRQISGLTSGSVFPLSVGRTRFGVAPGRVEFELDLDTNGMVRLTPGERTVRLDGVAANGPTLVGAAIIDVGDARFAVTRRRSDTPRRRVTLRTDGTITEPVIPVPDRSPAIDPDAFTHELRKRVSAARRVVMAQHRRSNPDPVELLTIAKRDDGQRWTRRLDDADFGRVSIAHAELPWHPRFDNIARIPNASAIALDDLRYLVAASVTTNLRDGALAIVGDRSAGLAVARQIMVSLATLTAPSDLEIAVLAPWHRAEAWHWADELPHTQGGGDFAVPLLFVDGVEQLDDSLGTALIESCGAGAVILADDPSEIPVRCSTSMLIAPDGRATIINHRTGETMMGATPLGLTERLAAAAATDLRDATLGAVQTAVG